MPSMLPYILLAVAAGATLPTQAGINAQLNLWTGSAVLAAAISFAVGTLALVLYALVQQTPLPAVSSLSESPWWVWSGGVIGAFFVVSTVLLAPKLGAAPMIGLIVGGQMLTSLFLDHFGLVGYPASPVTIWKILGMGCIVGGVALIRA